MPYLIRRVLSSLFTLWLAVTLVFALLRLLPGDGLTTQLIESGAPANVIAERRAALGLDAPLPVQYARYLGGLLRGDLGASLLSGQPVGELIAAQLPATLELALASLGVGIALGVSLGALSLRLTQPVLASLARAAAALALSAPVYWTGTIAVYVFAARLDLLPSGGAGRLSQLILPALVLGFSTAGGIAQVTQRALADVAERDHVQTASAKGLTDALIGVHHILRPALPAILTQIGIQAAFLLSGAVITESIFSRPGVGRLLLDAVLRQDYPLVQGIAVWSVVIVVVVLALVDLASALADPRLRGV